MPDIIYIYWNSPQRDLANMARLQAVTKSSPVLITLHKQRLWNGKAERMPFMNSSRLSRTSMDDARHHARRSAPRLLQVVHDREEPSAQIGAGLKEMALRPGPTKAILDKVISLRVVSTKRVSIATHPWNLLFQHPGEILQGAAPQSAPIHLATRPTASCDFLEQRSNRKETIKRASNIPASCVKIDRRQIFGMRTRKDHM